MACIRMLRLYSIRRVRTLRARDLLLNRADFAFAFFKAFLLRLQLLRPEKSVHYHISSHLVPHSR